VRRVAWIAAIGVALTPAVALAAEESTTFFGIPRPLWLTLNLVVFLVLLARYVGRPITRFLEERRAGIQQELEAARKKLAEAESLRQQVVERLEAVEREVQEMREQAEVAGRKEAERIRALAEEEAARFVEKVASEIGRRQAEVRQQLVADTATLAAELAKELLERETTDEDRKRILERSLAALASSGEGGS